MIKRFVLLLVMCAVLATGAFAYEQAEIKDEYYFDGKTLSEYALVERDFSLYSKNAFVINLDTGCVVFEKDSKVRAYPASTVKPVLPAITLSIISRNAFLLFTVKFRLLS